MSGQPKFDETLGFMTFEQKAVASRKFLMTLCAVHPGKASQLLVQKRQARDEGKPQLATSLKFYQSTVKLEDEAKHLIDAARPLNGIVAIVARYYGVSTKDLLSQRRVGGLSKARQVAYYLCRHHTQKTLHQIASALGDRDHSTILHGIRLITDLLETDIKLRYDVSTLQQFLTSALSQKRAA